jgi:hypothetical protein
MGRNATLARSKREAKKRQADNRLPQPWKNANDYEFMLMSDWALDMNTRWGRGMIVYYSNKMPTCYVLGSFGELGSTERLMIEQYAPWTEAVISVPSVQPIIATPEAYSSVPFMTRKAVLADLNVQIIVPKKDHVHPGLVFR